MSDAATTTKAEESSYFSPKEQKLIVAAMGSIKGGQPIEIDMDTFVKLGEFNTKKTAQNTWGMLKKKLIPADDGEGGVKMPATPKPKTPAKKRSKKDSDGEEGADGEAQEEGTPAKKAKTPRKTPAKKGKKATSSDDSAEEEAAGNDASPQKKPAKPRGKKANAPVREEETGTTADEETAVGGEDGVTSETVDASANEAAPVAVSEDTKMEGATE